MRQAADPQKELFHRGSILSCLSDGYESAVILFDCEHFPGDACNLVRQGYRDDVAVGPSLQSGHPFAKRVHLSILMPWPLRRIRGRFWYVTMTQREK